MQDSEPDSNTKVRDYFLNAVHISSANYDGMRASVIKNASALKGRVDSRDIQLDLDFEGTMRKLYAKEVEAAQAAEGEPSPAPAATVTPAPSGSPATPMPTLTPAATAQASVSPTPADNSA